MTKESKGLLLVIGHWDLVIVIAREFEMDGSLILRQLMWKEYRQQRDLWLALMIIGVVLQLLVVATAVLNNQTPDLGALLAVALIMPIPFALGCGATLFAGEHDAGTYQTLRSLPIGAGQILVNKFVVAALGLLSVPVPLFVTAKIAAQFGSWTYKDDLDFWPVIVLISLELFAWGVFFSLQSKRPLWSVVLSVGALGVTSLVILIAVSIFHARSLTGANDQLSGQYWTRQLVLHGIATVLILLDDVRLAVGWLNESPRRFRRLTNPALVGQKTLVDETEKPTPSRGRIYSRLLWHEWRQSVGLMAGVFAIVGLPGLFLLSVNSALYPAVWSLPVLASVLGGCAFLGDQRQNSHRFFAEHGVSARQVWLSRHLIWGGALAIWLTIFLALISFVVGTKTSTATLSEQFFPISRLVFDPPTAGASLSRIGALVLFLTAACFAIASYCAAQIGSLFIRSGIVGLFVGAFFSLLVCVWCILMAIARVPWMLSVLPLPLLCLWATWYHAPDWMDERTTWQSRLRGGAALASPLLLVLAVINYRIAEVPSASLPSDVQPPESISQEAIKTGEMYREAMNELLAAQQRAQSSQMESMGMGAGGMQMGMAPGGSQMGMAPGGSQMESMGMAPGGTAAMAGIDVAEGVSSLPSAAPSDPAGKPAATSDEPPPEPLAAYEKFLQASQRSVCHFDIYGQEADRSEVGKLVESVLQHATRLEAAGDSEGSLEFIFAALRFARHLYQTNTMHTHVKGDWVEAAALERLVQWCAKNRTPEQISEVRARLEQEFFSHKPARDRAIFNDLQFITEILSGESITSFVGGQELERYHQATTYMPWEKVRNRRLATLHASYALDELRKAESGMMTFDVTLDQSTWKRLERQIQSSLLMASMLTDHRVHALAAMRQETVRRAALLRLSILSKPAGQPLSVQELSVDPYSNNPFAYYHQGLPISLIVADVLQPGQQRHIPAVTPFVWSQGPNLVVMLPKTASKSISTGDEVFHPFVRANHGIIDDPPVRIQSMRELWESGLVFEIPER